MTEVPGLPLLQYTERPGIVDLGWGHPDSVLLPVAGLRAAAARTLDEFGPDALGYGASAGPGPLLEVVRDRLAIVDRRAPATSEILATAGTSWAIDQAVTLLARPGDAVLVESPTYHLAVRILREHPVELVPIPSDEGGLVVDAVPDALRDARARGLRVRLLYTVPTFNNPTGLSLGPERRRALVELAHREGFVILEDDAYRELPFDDPDAPPSLWSLGAPGSVVRLGSFSKSLAPGLRVGFLTADRATVARLAEGGVLDSGGGISHFAALVVAVHARSGAFAADVERLRAALRERRDALLDGLAGAMPPDVDWTTPGGGYFAWLTLPPGRTARSFLPEAEAHGVSFVPGSAFRVRSAATGRDQGVDAGRSNAGRPNGSAARTDRQGTATEGPDDLDRSLRLAFSRFPPDVLREAAGRLGDALR